MPSGISRLGEQALAESISKRTGCGAGRPNIEGGTNRSVADTEFRRKCLTSEGRSNAKLKACLTMGCFKAGGVWLPSNTTPKANRFQKRNMLQAKVSSI